MKYEELLTKEEQDILIKLSSPPKCHHIKYEDHIKYWKCIDCGLKAPKVTKSTLIMFR